jgi:hypothetical protein
VTPRRRATSPEGINSSSPSGTACRYSSSGAFSRSALSCCRMSSRSQR